MAMQFSHAVGYRGLASVGSSTLLCTGGSVSLTQDPIMSGGVWGAGYANAAPIAYAFNYLSLEGSANFEWVTTGSVWSALKSFAFSNRTSKTNVTLKPDGKNGFSGSGWCSSISFEASEGAAVTGSLNFKGDPSGNSITASGEGDTSANGMGGNGAGLVGAVLIPYWQTSVTFNGNLQKDIINWSCSYNSDLQVLKCCNYEATAPIAPDYILCGEMSGEGSFTVFKIAGDFNPTSYHSEKNASFRVGAAGSVTIPKVLISSGSTSMTTGASYVSVDYSMTALGDGTGFIMNMS